MMTSYCVALLLTLGLMTVGSRAESVCVTQLFGISSPDYVPQDALIPPNQPIADIYIPDVCLNPVGVNVTACDEGYAPQLDMLGYRMLVVTRPSNLQQTATIIMNVQCAMFAKKLEVTE